MLKKLKHWWKENQVHRDIYFFVVNRASAQHKIVALTYANDMMLDGAGAQLQRIYGVYALARLLRIPYFHSPLARIDYQGFQAVENNKADPEFVNRWNAAHPLPSDLDVLPSNASIVTTKDISLEYIFDLQKRAEREKRNFVLRILLPYGVTDRMPKVYETLKDFKLPDTYTKPNFIRLAVHMRRGDIMVSEFYKSRRQSNAFFKILIEQVSALLTDNGCSFEIELHTELPSKDFIITPDRPGVGYSAIREPVAVQAKEHSIDELLALSHVVPYINTDPIEAMDRMRTADILIISRSSFSYLAALLNPSALVIYNPFWHGPMAHWIDATEEGVLDTQKLAKGVSRIIERAKPTP